MTDAPERTVAPWWLLVINSIGGGAVCIGMALRFAEQTPTYFSMGLAVIAVVLISGGSSPQLWTGLMKIGLRLVAPAAKAVNDAVEKDKDK